MPAVSAEKQMVSKTERLLDLTLTLLETPVPLPRKEIRQRVSGYPKAPEETENFERMFERDKKVLRDQGVEIEILRIAATDPPEEGYTINPKKFYLTGLELTTGEQVALYLAQSAVSVGERSSDSAIRKLGGKPLELNADSVLNNLLAEIPNPPTLLSLLAAKVEGKVVEFEYGDHRRKLLVWRLDFSQSKWFVTGYDFLREAERTFSLNRISGHVSARPARPSEAAHAELPEDFNLNKMGIRAKPWEIAYETPIVAKLLVDVGQAKVAEQKLGTDGVDERQADGSVVFEVTVGHKQVFYSLVLFFLDEAEILFPESLKAGFVDYLKGLIPGDKDAEETTDTGETLEKPCLSERAG